jgi:YesN/AraC family two-component response regulator
MVLHIRNMESNRCITMVKNELSKLGLHYKSVELGEADLTENVSEEYLQLIDNALKEAGLELMENKNLRIIEKIKQAVHQMIISVDDMPKSSFSNYISSKININYTVLSNLFSGIQGITIEKYVIAQKIERVKELLVYDKLSLGDIAFKLQYSSVAHLSNQFKKVTGLTPSFFRQIRISGKHKT